MPTGTDYQDWIDQDTYRACKYCGDKQPISDMVMHTNGYVCLDCNEEET